MSSDRLSWVLLSPDGTTNRKFKNVSLQNLAICSCQSQYLYEAHKLFDEILAGDIHAWPILILGFGLFGLFTLFIEFFSLHGINIEFLITSCFFNWVLQETIGCGWKQMPVN
ncbi:uncharacterized protein LOC131174490 [Hevea brasiliensis]|uniref:uncharacterized protein LOC131174490 n=1 Tax=Hevea brasiliensis TaxID=3981 RepID=UPI0026008A78|nr:uncharacterized protein LOC131174490 [Hevea brasiliensis]